VFDRRFWTRRPETEEPAAEPVILDRESAPVRR
jgi:hypothetical protein